MPYYAPPDIPAGLNCHSASDGVFAFSRDNGSGTLLDTGTANTVVFEVQNGAGAWVSVATKADGGVVWDSGAKAWVATIQSTVWPTYPASVLLYRVRDTWADGFDSVMAFGGITFTDR